MLVWSTLIIDLGRQSLDASIGLPMLLLRTRRERAARMLIIRQATPI